MSVAVKKIIAVVIGFIMITASSFCGSKYTYDIYDVSPLTVDMLISSGIDKADKLMITAHPDDEVLWGGGHLMDGDYFVVVLTNGKNKVRHNEFESVIKESGNKGIILDYPDKAFGERDDWSAVYDKITADVNTVMSYKDWELVVTHNKKGEYGHIHHKMTHDIVTEVHKTLKSESKLYYFGKYYKLADIPDNEDKLTKMDESRIRFKEQLLTLYKSQEGTVKKLSHMNSYEMWEEN